MGNKLINNSLYNARDFIREKGSIFLVFRSIKKETTHINIIHFQDFQLKTSL